MRSGYAHAVDASQQKIVDALKAVGAAVFDSSGAGHGMPDLLVCYKRKLYLLECKNQGSPSRQKLRPNQAEFAKRFPVSVVNTPLEALQAIGAQ